MQDVTDPRGDHMDYLASETVRCLLCDEELLGQDAIWNDDLDSPYCSQEHYDSDSEYIRLKSIEWQDAFYESINRANNNGTK